MGPARQRDDGGVILEGELELGGLSFINERSPVLEGLRAGECYRDTGHCGFGQLFALYLSRGGYLDNAERVGETRHVYDGTDMGGRGLERFRTAQDELDSGFESAIAEIRGGHKEGHWIWYIFPQLAGLGVSAASETYAIDDLAEAVAYIRDPVLCARLLEMTETVARRIKDGISLRTLMGSNTDALKVVSSLTLFEVAAEKVFAADAKDSHRTLARAAGEVLAAAEREGYARCRYTLDRLGFPTLP